MILGGGGSSLSLRGNNRLIKPILQLFGSLKLGVSLLAALSVVLIAATIYESRTSTRAAQMLFYQSGWFIALLFGLGANVLCAALARYPWKRHQWGFAVTHLGIVVLLMGSIIGLLFGLEGTLSLIEGGAAESAIKLDYEVLLIRSRSAGDAIEVPLDTERHPVSAGERRRLRTRGLPIRLELLAVHPHSRSELVVSEGGTNRNAAVRFTLRSPMGEGSQPFEVSDWLVELDPERQGLALGPARFGIERVSTPEELERRLQPPPAASAAGKGILSIAFDGQDYALPVEQHLGRPYQSPDGTVRILIKDYYADFRMNTQTREPSSVSDQPNNPAVLFELTSGEGRCVGFSFAHFPDMAIYKNENMGENAVRAVYRFELLDGTGPRGGRSHTLTFLAGPEDQLHFVSRAQPSAHKAGSVKPGETIDLGWPIPATVTVDAIIPRPRLETRVVPASVEPGARFALPAVALGLHQEGESVETLVRWGEPATVRMGPATYDLRYAYAERPLGFAVSLKKFSAPRYEGTEMPASFESEVRVENRRNGEAIERKVWMNHPLTYQGYRISQASYQEGTDGEPDRSILQVVRDPGWPLKAAGSILIVLGIGLMFLRKTGSSKAQAGSAAASGFPASDPGGR